MLKRNFPILDWTLLALGLIGQLTFFLIQPELPISNIAWMLLFISYLSAAAAIGVAIAEFEARHLTFVFGGLATSLLAVVILNTISIFFY
ncbi:MAG: hypothetical protein WDZ70_00575 [Candidatus Paceibacterota bacterium]